MSELMTDAISLMVVGMGFVFVFLVILVFLTSLMSKIITKYLPTPEPVVAKSKTKKVNASQDAQLLAVLSAAVAEYRSDQKK
jgi:oxaloacetate decarboxylase gamma subunit